MSITTDDVYRIARLARLRTDDDEAAGYAENLSRILDLVEQMNAVDTDGIEPMAHPRDVSLRLRADEVTESSRRDELLAIAPAAESGLYLVPKVIE